METRDVSTKISLSEVPFVMRAMGFYPSEQEVRLYEYGVVANVTTCPFYVKLKLLKRFGKLMKADYISCPN